MYNTIISRRDNFAYTDRKYRRFGTSAEPIADISIGVEYQNSKELERIFKKQTTPERSLSAPVMNFRARRFDRDGSSNIGMDEL